MIKKVHHVTLLVESIEKSLVYYVDYMGLEVETEKIMADGNSKLVLMPVGDTLLELIQPLNEKSVFFSQLNEKGQCIHHVGLQTDNIRETIEVLKEKGYEFISDSPMIISEDLKMIYLNPEFTFGTMFSICQHDNTKEEYVSTDIIKCIDHVAFSSNEVKEFQHLLIDIFGLEKIKEVTTRALNILIKAGDVHLELVESKRGRKGYHHIAFETENENLALKKAKEMGYVKENEEINDRPEKGRGFYLEGDFTNGILNEIMYTKHLY